MSDSLVVIRELRKSFLHMGRKLEVLKGIDLEIKQGEIVAIVGKSGAGKSTLLQCIGTLDLPSSGIIRLGKRYLVGLSSTALAGIRNRMIGFVFQFHHLLPEFTALENVMMPGLIQGMPRELIAKRARTLLEDVGLKDRVTHRPGELSGGEQQRVALARALVLEPKLILADEPTGNLDSATSEAIHKLFFEINEKHGTTIVVVTHNVMLAESMPRIITMLDGKIDDDSGAGGQGDRSVEDRFEVDPAVLERSRALAKVQYGDFWLRGFARILDMSFMWTLSAVAATAAIFSGGLAMLGPPPPMRRLLDWKWILLSYAVGTVFQLVYHAVAESMGGATFGKMIFGLRVREESLKSASLASAFLRNIVFLLDGMLFGLVGYVAMNGSLIKQRFGDGVSRTVVVSSKSLPMKDSGGGLLGAVLGALVYLLASVGWLLIYYTQ